MIVEDIINLTKEEEVIFRFFLNEHAHHKTLKMFCVGHTLYKTSLYGMLSLFNYILFTSTPTNIPLLKQTLAYFRLEKDQISDYVEMFASHKSFGMYYYLDCQDMKMHHFMSVVPSRGETIPTTTSPDEELESNQKRREKILLEKFGSFFEDHPERVKAKSLLCILVRALPESIVRELDLSVKFQYQGKDRHISLIDYISLLLERRTCLTDSEQQVLHNYIKSKCRLPKYLVLNRMLQ